ncbi:MAG: cation diffusion facilitator family transporter [Betaproteobacteria bacterium]|nr:cation diffusion facilitator family transporter [Betaproteobacteria bacterium]
MSDLHALGIDPANFERYRAGQKVTWVSVAVNLCLSVLQVLVGYLGGSQALLADGMHSAADLVSDFLVLFANWHGNRSADESHPYGHARIETAATLILGAMLIGLGVLLLWRAGMRLQHAEQLVRVHVATLWIAIATLFAKESLFRYMRAVATRLHSQMLMANAWHSRSDAASSLVVVFGIVGNLAGFTFLDPVAAILVAFMIVRMGWKMGYDALSELVDTAPDEAVVAGIRDTLVTTPGVVGLHELKTRKMGNRILVDAHVLVNPRISVSEGHHVAEMARHRALDNDEVLDVMVHIDPEDDTGAEPSVHLPGRDELVAHLRARLAGAGPDFPRVVLHYLGGRAEAELFLPRAICQDTERVNALKQRIDEILRDDPYFGRIEIIAFAP